MKFKADDIVAPLKGNATRIILDHFHREDDTIMYIVKNIDEYNKTATVTQKYFDANYTLIARKKSQENNIDSTEPKFKPGDTIQELRHGHSNRFFKIKRISSSAFIGGKQMIYITDVYDKSFFCTSNYIIRVSDQSKYKLSSLCRNGHKLTGVFK